MDFFEGLDRFFFFWSLSKLIDLMETLCRAMGMYWIVLASFPVSVTKLMAPSRVLSMNSNFLRVFVIIWGVGLMSCTVNMV